MKRLRIQLNIAVAGLVLIIVGLIPMPESWHSLLTADPRSYGQGYFPLLSALGLSICGLVLLMEAFQTRQFKRYESIQWSKLFRGPGISIIGLIAYAVIMKLLGFGITTFLFLLILLRILKAYSWVNTLIISFTIAISFHYIFRVLLYLPLPRGLLF